MPKRVDDTTCHCLKMRRSAQNVVAFYDAAVAPAGVTVRQYSLLDAIARADGPSAATLAERCQLDRSTAVRSLRPLVSRGLVEDLREPGARDGRLALTAEGERVRAQAAVLWADAQRRFEERLGAERVRLLESILGDLQGL